MSRVDRWKAVIKEMKREMERKKDGQTEGMQEKKIDDDGSIRGTSERERRI